MAEQISLAKCRPQAAQMARLSFVAPAEPQGAGGASFGLVDDAFGEVLEGVVTGVVIEAGGKVEHEPAGLAHLGPEGVLQAHDG